MRRDRVGCGLPGPTSNVRRFPLEPLAYALGVQVGPPSVKGTDGHPIGHGAIAEKLGVNVRTVRRYAKDGIPEKNADYFAVKAAGKLPWEVWDDYYDDDCPTVEED